MSCLEEINVLFGHFMSNHNLNYNFNQILMAYFWRKNNLNHNFYQKKIIQVYQLRKKVIFHKLFFSNYIHKSNYKTAQIIFLNFSLNFLKIGCEKC